MGSPKEICSAERISRTVFCKLLKIQLLPWAQKTRVAIFTWLPVLNWNFMLISFFLTTYCVEVQLGVRRKTGGVAETSSKSRTLTIIPRESPVNFSAIATWSICTNLSCQCLFRVSPGNNPETSS